jgi:hypothetical protein
MQSLTLCMGQWEDLHFGGSKLGFNHCTNKFSICQYKGRYQLFNAYDGHARHLHLIQLNPNESWFSCIHLFSTCLSSTFFRAWIAETEPCLCGAYLMRRILHNSQRYNGLSMAPAEQKCKLGSKYCHLFFKLTSFHLLLLLSPFLLCCLGFRSLCLFKSTQQTFLKPLLIWQYPATFKMDKSFDSTVLLLDYSITYLTKIAKICLMIFIAALFLIQETM